MSKEEVRRSYFLGGLEGSRRWVYSCVYGWTQNMLQEDHPEGRFINYFLETTLYIESVFVADGILWYCSLRCLECRRLLPNGARMWREWKVLCPFKLLWPTRISLDGLYSFHLVFVYMIIMNPSPPYRKWMNQVKCSRFPYITCENYNVLSSTHELQSMTTHSVCVCLFFVCFGQVLKEYLTIVTLLWYWSYCYVHLGCLWIKVLVEKKN